MEGLAINLINRGADVNSKNDRVILPALLDLARRCVSGIGKRHVGGGHTQAWPLRSLDWFAEKTVTHALASDIRGTRRCRRLCFTTCPRWSSCSRQRAGAGM
eukprot:299287-Rhodomonas_salina.3